MPMLQHISEAVFFLVNTEYTLFAIKFLVFFEGLFHFLASTAGVFFWGLARTPNKKRQEKTTVGGEGFAAWKSQYFGKGAEDYRFRSQLKEITVFYNPTIKYLAFLFSFL